MNNRRVILSTLLLFEMAVLWLSPVVASFVNMQALDFGCANFPMMIAPRSFLHYLHGSMQSTEFHFVTPYHAYSIFFLADLSCLST
jgi:hypothetical protein